MNGLRSLPSTARDVFARDRTALAVVGLTVLALLARVVALGQRVAQYDEAWIGHWILRYAETGSWQYNPIYHGPFLPQVNRHLFGLLGASDFTARLPVAVVGGTLPLVALLFRDRLRDAETVALAGLLALNPILLYYSRFARFDVPLAAFGLWTVAFATAAVSREDPRYLYPAGVALGLTTTTKESFLLYLLTWVGAAALVADGKLTADRRAGRNVRSTLQDALDRVRAARAYWRPTALSCLLAAVVVVYFYAPRSVYVDSGGSVFFQPRAGATDRVGLWTSLTDPGELPTVLGEATLGSLAKLYEFWVAGGMQNHPYVPYLADYLRTLGEGAPLVVGLATVGFLVDRYADRQRPLVAFCAFWGGAFVLGYPLANFLPTPWATVHAVVPLAVPAAVGAGAVYRVARRSRVRTGVVAVLALLVGSQVAATAVTTSYLEPQDWDSELVYQSQSPADMKPTLKAIRAAVRDDEGTDVLYYGPWYNLTDESVADYQPAYGGWHRRLPLAWYFESYDATVNSTTSMERVRESDAPVVIARARNRSALFAALDGYAYVRHNLSQTGRDTVFLVDADRIPERYVVGDRRGAVSPPARSHSVGLGPVQSAARVANSLALGLAPP